MENQTGQKKEKLYVAQHIAQKVSEATVDGSNSEVGVHSKKRQPKWTNDLDKGKQMFCMAFAMEDNYSDVEDTELYTIVLLWDKYAHKRLPMGIACTFDIFQSIMMDLLGDVNHVLLYIDDILIVQKIGKSEADHMKKIKQVLKRLDAKGFLVNLHKSFFMQKEVEYLRYLLIMDGLKPQPAKIEVMHRIMRPLKN